MISLNRFDLLLNNISNELNQRNLQSLIHVCRNLIHGSQQEKINSGLEVFSILRQRNAIGEEPEKMKFLLRIMKELRPKRKDLVNLVTRHIEDNYEEPETILDDMESSSDGHLTPRPPTPQLVDDCCSVRCGCFNCNCNPCCSGCCCCVIMAILLSFFSIVAALVWYTYVFPRSVQVYLKHHDMSGAGPFVIGVLLFIAACCISCGIYICIKQRRNQELAYSVLTSINDAKSMSNQAVYGSYAASDSTQTSCSRQIYRHRRRECSCSSGRITASSSLASVSSARMQWRSPDLDAVRDGCLQQDVIIQEIEANQENKEDNEIIEV